MVASLLFKWITSYTNNAIVLKLFSWHCSIRNMITFTDWVRNTLDWQQAIRDGETKLRLSLLPDGDDPTWYPQDSYRSGGRKGSRDKTANSTISKWVILIYKNNIHVVYSGNVHSLHACLLSLDCLQNCREHTKNKKTIFCFLKLSAMCT